MLQYLKKDIVARGLLGLFTHVCTSLSGFATFLSWGHLILFCYSVVPWHCEKTTDIFNIVSLVSLMVGPKKQDFYLKMNILQGNHNEWQFAKNWADLKKLSVWKFKTQKDSV